MPSSKNSQKKIKKLPVFSVFCSSFRALGCCSCFGVCWFSLLLPTLPLPVSRSCFSKSSWRSIILSLLTIDLCGSASSTMDFAFFSSGSAFIASSLPIFTTFSPSLTMGFISCTKTKINTSIRHHSGSPPKSHKTSRLAYSQYPCQRL